MTGCSSSNKRESITTFFPLGRVFFFSTGSILAQTEQGAGGRSLMLLTTLSKVLEQSGVWAFDFEQT